MPAYKTYFKILKKLRTPILIYTIMFVVLSYAITANSKIGSDVYRASKVKTMIINEDGQSELIDGFLSYLDPYIMTVAPVKDEESRKDALFLGETEYILTIPKGFSDSFIGDGTVKLSKEAVPNSAGTMSLDNVIDNYFNLAKTYLAHVPGLDYSKLNNYIKENTSSGAKAVLSTNQKDGTAAANEFNLFYFNFLAYVLIGALITGVSMIMHSFNGLDIRRRHNASPVSYRKLNLQLVLANLVFVIGYVLLFIMIGLVINKSKIINMNLILTWVNALVFGVTILSVSYLIGISVTSRKAIGAISTAVSLGVAFISGVFVPQQYLGRAVLRVASFTPAYWYIRANDSLASITSFEWSQVSKAFGCMAVQIGFAIAFLSLSLVVSKRKRMRSF